MRNRTRLRVTSLLTTLVVVALLTASPAGAGEENAGTYGAPSLKIPVGAKLMSAPDVLAGMEPDASLLFSNPAFLAALPDPQIFMSTSNWLQDMRLSAISASVPSRGLGLSFSGGASLLYSGGLNGYDESYNVISEESYYDLAVSGAVVKRFDSIGLSLSAGGTWLRQHLYPTDGSGFAFTGGAVYQRGANTVHFVAKNIGGSVDFSDASYDIDNEKIAGYGRSFPTGMGSVMAGIQMVYSSAAPERVELGLGYRFNHLFTIRTSMRDVTDSRSEGMVLDAGFSVRYNQIAVDYAYTPHEYFSTTHTFSLAFTFQGNRGGMNTLHDEEEPAVPAREKTVEQPVESGIQIVPEARPPVSARTVAPKQAFLLVAGTYSWENGARDEVRALELQGVTARVQRVENRFLVVLGRYEDRQKASKALQKMEKAGQSARIVSIGP